MNLVASTIPEIEHLLPLLKELRARERRTNILYGIPLSASQVPRLAHLAQQLGQGSISVLVDSPAQLSSVARLSEESESPVGVFLKVDTGYHRAGLPPSGMNKDGMIAQIMQMESRGNAELVGLYSHSSLSYNDSTPQDAMSNLKEEILGCLDALEQNSEHFFREKTLTISVGASPQVTAVENLLSSQSHLQKSVESLQTTIRKVTSERPSGFKTALELHAGVYSILDVQQLSTHSRTSLGDYEDEIALFITAEVCSLYNNNERQQPEALLAVGALGLGREPCVAYKGWGILDREAYSRENASERRLIVTRVSQEHCIVAWGEGKSELLPIPLEVGQKVHIFPNHACVAGAMFGWYLVVDSDSGKGETIVDVCVRASGW